jgi:hypothetical protein
MLASSAMLGADGASAAAVVTPARPQSAIHPLDVGTIDRRPPSPPKLGFTALDDVTVGRPDPVR